MRKLHRSTTAAPPASPRENQDGYLTFPGRNFREHVLADRPKPHSQFDR
jgi:hypothetical protein